MRLTGLLALLLFILIVFFAAPAASFAQTAPAGTSKPTAKADVSPLFDRAFADLDRLTKSGSEIERNGVCYTMRTYIMARADKNSDVTRMVRATRCLPAWKLEFKTASEPETRPTDHEPATR
jgi:hypothetical protein